MAAVLELLIPIVVALITGILGPVIIYFIKRREKKTSLNKSDSIKKIELDLLKNRLQSHLDQIRNTIEADRVWVAHIKPKTPDIAVMSVIFESVGTGVSNEIDNFQDILSTFFKDTLQELEEDNYILYSDKDEIENFEVVRLFEQRGNVSMFLFSLKTLDEIMVGILGIDFVKSERELNDLEKRYLINQATLLVGYLEILLMSN